jgi:hypothetical protein
VTNGGRYYLSLFALNGTRVLTLPLIESADRIPVESASWANGFVTLTFADPHGFQLYETVNLNITGAVPDAYNGSIQCFVPTRTTIRYPLASDPGAMTTPGAVEYIVNLVGGYFDSALIFRASSARFEATP